MPRKARQGARPKKKQTRTRKQSAPTARLAGPSAEPGLGTAPVDPAENSGKATITGPAANEQRPRTTARGSTPYLHRRGRHVATVRATAASAYGLPREREYGYIRSDLRRLILTAAVLAIMMVALLVMLEP